MRTVLASIGLLAVSQCVKLQGYIATQPTLPIKGISLPDKAMYIPTVQQPTYISQPMVQQQPQFTYIPQPMSMSMPMVQQQPQPTYIAQPMVQQQPQPTYIAQPMVQPTYIQPQIPSYLNTIGSMPSFQIPSIDFNQNLMKISGVQNYQNNLATTNDQNVVVNTSANSGSNANTSMNNNAYSTSSNTGIVS